ncbi:MAG: chaperonin GroEL, partial [Dehalococcoidia bacterium]|nr:chaperonin GroEL [Dehalococcoidia bacterium]
LIRARKALYALAAKTKNPDEKVGIEILAEALEGPAWIIADNAGLEGSVIVNKIMKLEDPTQGWDANADVWGDMFELGIVDPVKVTRSAVENAVSISSLVLTTEALVAELPAGAVAPPPPPEMY